MLYEYQWYLRNAISSKTQTKITYYHTDNETWNKNDIYTTHYEINKNIDTNSSSPINSSSKLHYHQEEISFTTNILGKIHHDYVALAYDIVETIRNQYNLPKPIMKKNISLQLQPGRMSLFHGLYNSIIIDSTYNSSPLSLKKVIEESNNLHKELYPDYIRIYILGDMRELWESENQHHTELADYLGSFITQKDYIIFLWQAIQTTYDKIQKSFNSNNKRGKIKNQSIYHYLHYSEVSKKVTELVKELSQKNKKSFILAKGSQNTIFLEEVVKSLLVNMKDSKYLTRQSDRWLSKK